MNTHSRAPAEHLTIHEDDLDYHYSLESVTSVAEEPDTESEMSSHEDRFEAGLRELLNEGGETEAGSEHGVSFDMAEFEAGAVEPDELGAFPMPPEETTDVDGDNNRIIGWHLRRLGVALDGIKEAISDDEAARDWLEFKMLVAAGKNMQFSVGKWYYLNDLEAAIEPFVNAHAGDMHRG